MTPEQHVDCENSEITVLITTSTTRFHPDTNMMDATIDSARFWLPEARIIALCDGVWPEWESRRNSYEEYKKRLREKHKDIEIKEHGCLHQSGMVREILPSIKTPLILVLEHDGPLVTEHPTDWHSICQCLENGDANLIEFLLLAMDMEPHSDKSHLMRGEVELYGSRFMKTVDWRSCGHIATKEYYERIMPEYYSRNLPMMLEKPMSWAVANAPWEEHKVMIYYPTELGGKRKYHLDGRMDDWRSDARDGC